MGVLPLQFKTGESAETHRLTGQETYSVLGLEIGIAPGQDATVQVEREDGHDDRIAVTVRIDQAAEVGISDTGASSRWSCARRSRAPDDAGAHANAELDRDRALRSLDHPERLPERRSGHRSERSGIDAVVRFGARRGPLHLVAQSDPQRKRNASSSSRTVASSSVPYRRPPADGRRCRAPR